MKLMTVRMSIDQWGSPTGKTVTYSELFALWILQPGNQDALEAMENKDELLRALDGLSHLSKEQLDRERAEIVFRNDRAAFLTAMASSGVFKQLVEGINPDDAPGINLRKLLENFRKVRFDYTMVSRSADSFLKGSITEGDCNTLVRSFEKIAQFYLGIRDVSYHTSMQHGFPRRFSAPRRQTVGVPKTGNVNHGAFWVFENHYWIEHEGTVYDVLFGTIGMDRSTWGQQIGVDIEPETFEVKDASIASTETIQVWSTGSDGDITERWTTTAPRKEQ